MHTRYDAGVLGNPGLGVTSVVVGNCSLSTVYSEADDCADMFAGVEALPCHSPRYRSRAREDRRGGRCRIYRRGDAIAVEQASQ